MIICGPEKVSSLVVTIVLADSNPLIMEYMESLLVGEYTESLRSAICESASAVFPAMSCCGSNRGSDVDFDGVPAAILARVGCGVITPAWIRR